MAEWRDISTAPRDGTLLLLCAGGEPVLGYFETSKEWPSSAAGFNDWTTGVVTQGQYDCGSDRLYQVTHWQPLPERSEEHTSELQSLMRISYAVFCLKKKILITRVDITYTTQ